jgi:hypothetical protein
MGRFIEAMEANAQSNDNRRRWPREPITVVEPLHDHSHEPSVDMSVGVVADLQDSLLVAMNDLKRLEGLLDHATANLLDRFNTAMESIDRLPGSAKSDPVRQALHAAVTELQFHDMANQLLVHTGKVLQGCAYKLAEQAMEPDEYESGVLVQYMPERPNPVTQSEMDAGSVDLF